MTNSTRSSDAGVVDILYAVALGEGFFAAVYRVREEIIAGQFALVGTGGQTLLRVLLGFLVIIISWVYYRRAVVPRRHYPVSEFTADIVVMIAYMGLLSFSDWPIVFYSIIAVIWLLYLLARIVSRQMNKAYLMFGLAFVAYFAVAAISAYFYQGIFSEWLRLTLVMTAVIAYRLFDVRLRLRFGFD